MRQRRDVTERLDAAADDRPLAAATPPPEDQAAEPEQDQAPAAEQEPDQDDARTPATTAAQPPATSPAAAAPVGEEAAGFPFPGVGIADTLADDGINAMLLGIDDPLLRHELLWTRAAARAAFRMTAYHADRRPFGEAGPQLAPMSLVEAGYTAMQHIFLRRRAETDNGQHGSAG